MRATAIPMDLARLLAGQDEQEKAPEPCPEAQALELLRRYDVMQNTENLQPRDLVVEKSGVGALDEEDKGKQLFIFIRDLDPADEGDHKSIMETSQSATMDKADCVIGYVREGRFKYVTHRKAMLTRWTGVVPQ